MASTITMEIINNLPASLRTPDIAKFAVQAVQSEKANPVVSYWSESFFSPLPISPYMKICIVKIEVSYHS